MPKTALKVLTLTLTLFVDLGFAAAANTPDYWNCSSQYTKGTWDFGRAPAACAVSTFMAPALISKQYQPVIFNEAQTISPERIRYMSALFPVLRDVGTYYIKKRKPNVTAAEVQGFLAGLYTTAHKETYWSHYRNVGDGILRYMRGDFGHGHGLMQVDDRSHLNELSEGKGVDLIENLIYGLSVYYRRWEDAAKAACLSSPTNYKARARAAWSGYNGGPDQVCRWTNPNSAYAEFDKVFLQMYEGKAWENYVKNEAARAPLDIQCLTEGARPCGLPGLPTQKLVSGGLYKIPDAKYCLFQQDILQCVSEYRDVACIEAMMGKSLGAGEVITDDSVLTGKKIRTFDRGALCSVGITGLFGSGQSVTLQKDVNLRASPETGAIQTLLKTGMSYTIVGFEVRDWANQDRYYRIKTGNFDGYFYAGTKSDFKTWATLVTPGAMKTLAVQPTTGLSSVGDRIRIVNAGGIHLRAQPGGQPILSTVPAETILEVRDVHLRGNNAGVYYEVEYEGRSGFVYAGAIDPVNTLASWIVSAGGRTPTYVLLETSGYRNLRSCAEVSCLPNGKILKAQIPATVSRTEGSWSFVTNTQTGESGWILGSEIREVQP